MTARFLLGVDGGGSKTLLRLTTPAFGLVAERRLGPANISSDAAGAALTIETGMHALLADAGLSVADLPYVVGACGFAGAGRPDAVDRFRAALHTEWLRALPVVSDAQTSCVGAHAGLDGAILAIGTGSIFFAIVAGDMQRAGGLGFLTGDEGGGAWIGREAVRATQKETHRTLVGSLVERHCLDRNTGLPRWPDERDGCCHINIWAVDCPA